jgi:pectate lyase
MRNYIRLVIVTISILKVVSLVTQDLQAAFQTNLWLSRIQKLESDTNNVPDWSEPIGFASIDGDNFNGPTNGGGDIATSVNIVYINGISEFTKLVTLLYDRIKAYKYKDDYLSAKYAPLIIVLEEDIYPETDEIPNTGSVWGNSMLTIQEQGDLTIIGRGNVVLNFGINVKRSWNIIIRNITFQDYYDDGVNVGEPETHHVWVDHCTFGNSTALPANSEHPDGGCDIKNGTSYITVSWCLFRNNWKTSLIGHSDNNWSTDSGRLKVTYFCNYFLHSNSRQPRVRFGEVHILNCFYDNTLLYGIASANSAQVYAEANFFLNTVFPMYADRTVDDFAAVYGPLESYTGNYPCIGLKQINNLYDDNGLSTVLTGSFVNVNVLNPGNKSIKFDELNPESVFEPASYYNYTAIDAATVPDLVKKYAGAGAVDFFITYNTGTISVNHGADNTSHVFPNPATDNMYITTDVNSNLKILNAGGKIVLEKTISTSPYIINIDEAGLTPGFYIIIIENKSGIVTSKFLKM